MAAHSSILTWRIPWTEEFGGIPGPLTAPSFCWVCLMWGNIVRCLTDGSQCEALGALSLVGCLFSCCSFSL